MKKNGIGKLAGVARRGGVASRSRTRHRFEIELMTDPGDFMPPSASRAKTTVLVVNGGIEQRGRTRCLAPGTR